MILGSSHRSVSRNSPWPSCDLLGRMMPVIHDSGECNQAGGGERDQREPGLDSVTALIEEMHLAGKPKPKEAESSKRSCESGQCECKRNNA